MPIYPYQSIKPQISKTAFIAPTASIIGKVIIEDYASIWFNCVIRADINHIHIKANTNIQDSCVLHITEEYPVEIANNVTVGHKVLLHGANVGSNSLIGMGAILLDGVKVGENSFIAAGSLVTPRTNIPPNSFVLGSPARVIRPIKPEELLHIKENVSSYITYGQEYLKELNLV